MADQTTYKIVTFPNFSYKCNF